VEWPESRKSRKKKARKSGHITFAAYGWSRICRSLTGLATDIDFTYPDGYAIIKKEIGKKLEPPQEAQVAFTILTLTPLTD